MPLPTRSNVLTLEYTGFGQPAAYVEAKTLSPSSSTLDYTLQAQPVFGLFGSAPPIPTADGEGLYSLTGAIRVTINDTSVSYGLYAADGSLRITVVTGSSYTGLYAADGSINVVNEAGSLYHPCGAIRGRPALTTYTGRYSPSGAFYMAGLA